VNHPSATLYNGREDEPRCPRFPLALENLEDMRDYPAFPFAVQLPATDDFSLRLPIHTGKRSVVPAHSSSPL